MIELNQISKRFGKIEAVSQMTGEIREGSVFGLVGTNGAGKSTCLRMMAGVLKPDEGRVLVDGQDIYENEKMKSRVFFISDDQYYLPNSTPEEMMEYYRIYYTCFDEQRFYELLEKFRLEKDRKISTFSKGMKKQLSVILGICANTKYLLCDETFDGLDPDRETVDRNSGDRSITFDRSGDILGTEGSSAGILENICGRLGVKN